MIRLIENNLTGEFRGEKQEQIQKRRSELDADGNLENDDLESLLYYEFTEDELSLEEQLTMHYLKLKSKKPKEADVMLEELRDVGEYVATKNGNEKIVFSDDINKFCEVLYKFMPHFKIVHEGKEYKM